jgi:hypothetical protein
VTTPPMMHAPTTNDNHFFMPITSVSLSIYFRAFALFIASLTEPNEASCPSALLPPT